MHPAATPAIRPRDFSVGISDTDEQPGADTNTVTFSAMDAGVPRPDRVLIAAVHFRDGTEDATFSRPCTIGGVAATEVVAVGAAGGGGTAFCALYAALVPDGPTADVVVAVSGFSGTINDWGCTLVRATGLVSATAVETETDFFSGGVVALDTAGAKFAVVVCADINTDQSAKLPYSQSGASVLTLGHRMARGLAFIDTKVAGTVTGYSTVGYAAFDPDFIAAACWG
jgi:hypothetical protein